MVIPAEPPADPTSTFEPDFVGDPSERYFKELEKHWDALDREDDEISQAEEVASRRQEKADLVDNLVNYIGTRHFPMANPVQFGNDKKLRAIAEYLVESKGVDSLESSDHYVSMMVMQARTAGHAAKGLSPLDRAWLLVHNQMSR